MSDSAFKIPKQLRPVTLWVHPDGQVMGSLFLHLPTQESPDGELPVDALNGPGDFLPVKREDPDDLRFYNKSAIVRVTYWDPRRRACEHGRPQACRLTLMDGTLIYGEIWKAAPEERSRLYDYMNDTRERFLELRVTSEEVTLINKSYVVFISADTAPPAGAQPAVRAPVAEPVIEFAL